MISVAVFAVCGRNRLSLTRSRVITLEIAEGGVMKEGDLRSDRRKARLLNVGKTDATQFYSKATSP